VVGLDRLVLIQEYDPALQFADTASKHMPSEKNVVLRFWTDTSKMDAGVKDESDDESQWSVDDDNEDEDDDDDDDEDSEDEDEDDEDEDDEDKDDDEDDGKKKGAASVWLSCFEACPTSRGGNTRRNTIRQVQAP
jgi:hypothetical protein